MADIHSNDPTGDLRPEPKPEMETPREPQYDIPDPEREEDDREKDIHNDRNENKRKPAA